MHAAHSLLLRLALGVLCAAATTLSAADVLIENVSIVSPELAAPATNRHVLIRGERIAQISARALAAQGATRVDGRGRYLTPGVMDSHVHVSTPPGLPWGSEDPAITALTEAFVRQQPRSYLYFGVTQVLDLTGIPEGIDAFQAQPVRPDFFRCGQVIVLNGYPAALLESSVRHKLAPDYVYEPANASLHPLPAGADPARHTPEAVVDRIAASGARCVKVFIEDGFGDSAEWPIMSAQTLERVRAAAQRRKLPLLAHANAIDMQKIALDARVDVLAHGLWNWNEYRKSEGMPEPIAAHLKAIHARKIGFQPTLRVLAGTADLFRADTLRDPIYAKVVPPALLAWYASEAGQWFKRDMQGQYGGAPDMKIQHAQLKVNELNLRTVRYLHTLGHPLLLGSDTPSAPTYGNQPGYDTYREMRLMAQAGVSMRGILEAATINNARQFGLAKDYGSVESGKLANLLLLKGNPLESVRAWSEIDRIVLRGKVIERETLAAK